MTTKDSGNNFYSFFESFSRNRLHIILLRHGWITVHEDNERIELSNEWSDLTICVWDNVVQLNGRLCKGLLSYNSLTTIFGSEGARFQSEIYDENGSLLAAHSIKGS